MPLEPEFLVGLPPVIDAGIETLILGSFPSPASLAAQQYYAHRQNQFWRIMAEITGESLPDIDYAERKSVLLRRHIGVWDVYCRCRRQGALDAAIRDAVPNDFSTLGVDSPQLRRVCFNGKTSARFESFFVGLGYDVRQLPSTSPAYTLAFHIKLERWRAGLISGSDQV